MLSDKRAEVMVKQLTGVAQKVLDAVPIQEGGSKHQIGQELHRRSIGIDINTLGGVLNSLVRSELVAESQGRFRKAPIRPRLVAASTTDQEEEMKPSANTQKPKQDLSELDRLSALAARIKALHKTAESLSGALGEVADDVEEAALEIAERAQADGSEMEKLKQLKALLKDL